MKIDAYSHIQLTSVYRLVFAIGVINFIVVNNYRGHTPVSAEEVFKLYGGTHIPAHFLEATATDGRHTRLKQFIDLFSIPEVTLLADTSEVRADTILLHPVVASNEAVAYNGSGRDVTQMCQPFRVWFDRDPLFMASVH